MVFTNQSNSYIIQAMKRALTGIRPTGDLHLGNYLGTIRPALALQKEYECFFFIADLHALTTQKNGDALRKSVIEIAAAWIALGLDTNKHFIYRQSYIPEVTEYTWYLSSVTGMGLLEKAHAYKDAAANGNENTVSHAVFMYPVLMASDILMYSPDVVPVGKDQKQHVEMARDIAGSFNAIYGETIKLAAPLIDEKVMTIPGLDGRKMSKSYNNTIPVFVSEEETLKLIKTLTTDSTPLEASKELGGTLIGDLYKLFVAAGQYEDLKTRMKQGGMGWGHAKLELAAAINMNLKDARAKYKALMEDKDSVIAILEEGEAKARKIALAGIEELRKRVGVR